MITLQAADGRRLQVTPGVTYQRGKMVDGVDVGLWLDEYYEKQAAPEGWRSVISGA